MPLEDVTVTIDLVKPAGLIGFGKPLILTSATGGKPYKLYYELTGVEVDYAKSSEAYKAAAAQFAQKNKPESVAIAAFDSAGGTGYLELLESVYGRDWYFVTITSTAVEDILEVANYIEANKRKMFAARAADMATLEALKLNDYERTFVLYHTDTAEVAKYPDAAWVGEAGSRLVGEITWKFKTLTGILPDELTLTELMEIHSNGGNAYLTKAGKNVTSEGMVVSGEYIDVIMAKDWVEFNVEHSIQTLLNDSPKVPFTNSGIAQLEAATINVLKIGFNQGIIAADGDGLPLYSTDFPTRDEVPASDRAARKYSGASFTFELAGAVHQAAITGTITV
ncbi:DUF3383 family protein [Paenibacillus glucanolyticus]|uniref:DUF3383 family protein n=1 Tax=Paenibacillus glucanolyticus TaxID=59843 RepID=UPI0035DA84BB